MSSGVVNSLRSGIKVNGWHMINDEFSDLLIKTIVSNKPGFFKKQIAEFVKLGFEEDEELIKFVSTGLTDLQKVTYGLVFNYRSGKRTTYIKETPVGQAMLIHDIICSPDWELKPEELIDDAYEPLDLKTQAKWVNVTIDELKEQHVKSVLFEILALRLPENSPLDSIEQYLL